MNETEKTTTIKSKMGRPIKWTDKKIDEMVVNLLNWVAKDDSYALIQFCCEECITRHQLTHLSTKSEDFSSALSYAKSKIASRMISNLNSKDGNCHPAFFNKYVRANDFLLDSFIKDQEKVQINEMNKRDVRVIDFSRYKKDKENGVD